MEIQWHQTFAAITKMRETSVCNYNIEVCTPLLCDGIAELFQEGLVAKEINGNAINPVPASLSSWRTKENASIRELLEGMLHNVCLHFFKGR
jgi:hypothetical protein